MMKFMNRNKKLSSEKYYFFVTFFATFLGATLGAALEAFDKLATVLAAALCFFTTVLPSKWIGNFGVVPLFLFAAFLFFPAFFTLFFLTIVVIFVFETMNALPLSKWYFSYLVILITFLHLGQFNSQLFAKEIETIILAKGEQRELPLAQLKKYSLGNKEILSTKFIAQSKTFFLKGKSIGITDLIIWDNKMKKKFIVYVVSKKEQLEHAQWIELFKNSHIEAEFQANFLHLKGIISTKEEWNIITKLIHRDKAPTILKMKIQPKLKKSLLTEVYLLLEKKGLSEFSCNIIEIPFVDCFINEQDFNAEFVKQMDEQNYLWRWNKRKISSFNKNFQIKLKIFSLESQKNEVWQMGIEKIIGSLKEFFNLGPWELMKRNQTIFKNNHIHFNVLAEPHFNMNSETKAEFQVGSEIPYLNPTSESRNETKWKFAGLKISLSLNQRGKDYFMHYQTELTRPGENSSDIQGSQQSATVVINPKREMILFEIGLQAMTSNTENLPFWEKIPLLKKLFSSQLKGQSYKKIVGLIQMSEEK